MHFQKQLVIFWNRKLNKVLLKLSLNDLWDIVSIFEVATTLSLFIQKSWECSNLFLIIIFFDKDALTYFTCLVQNMGIWS